MAVNVHLTFLLGYFAFCSALYEKATYQDIIFGTAEFQDLVLKGHFENEGVKLASLAYDFFGENTEVMTPWKLLSNRVVESGWSTDHPCRNGVERTIEALKKKENWALRMIDATGKPASGIMELNIAWLGRFSECMETVATQRQADNSTKNLFKGQYCIATFKVPDVPPGTQGFGVTSGLSIGLCVPSTCSKADIGSLLKDITPKNGSWSATVDNYQPESIPLTSSAIAVISLLSVIGFVVLLGTLYDVCIHQPALERAKSAVIAVVDPVKDDALLDDDDRPLNVEGYTPLLKERQEEEAKMLAQSEQRSVPMRVLLAFSVYSNGLKILSTKRTPGSLDCIHGIRFFSMTWVFIGHVLAFTFNYTSNVAVVFTWLKRWTIQPIGNGTFSVDSFFLLSGTLVSYLLLKQLKKKDGPRNVNWGLFYFHRFWRLTPVYMLVLAFDAALFRYMGSGPIWPHENGIDPYCKDNWWTNFLYINNFVHPSKMCLAWSWYLANDMQLFIISPLIVIAFYYKWFAGLIVSLVLILANFVTVALLVVERNEINMLTSFNDIYIKPYCRMGPYIVGIMTGYVLFITDKNKPVIHKGFITLGWMLAAACNLAVIYGLVNYEAGLLKPMPLHLAGFYMACSRTAWGLGLAWVVFACCRGYGGFVNTLLSWQGLIPLSRLTYTAYLVHPIILFFYNFSLHETIYMTEIVYIWIVLGCLVVVYGVAFVTSLAFEAPMMGLEKIVFSRR